MGRAALELRFDPLGAPALGAGLKSSSTAVGKLRLLILGIGLYNPWLSGALRVGKLFTPSNSDH